MDFLKISCSVCPWCCSFSGFCWNHDFLPCLEQSATTKMTVPTVGSFHGFHVTVSLTGYLPVRFTIYWKSRFQRFLLIDLFLCNQVISRLFVMEYVF
jgi:hypothetical protein